MPARHAAAFALAFVCALPSASHGACDAPTLMLERFVSADCEACWKTQPPAPTPAPKAARNGAPFVLDWIVPSVRGGDAPLTKSAVSEATARAQRAGGLGADEALTVSTPLPARSALRLRIQDGPAWNGYIGLQFEASYSATRPLPQGLAGYLALVERIPADAESTPVTRQLVRTVVGPLSLDGLAERRKVDHLRAVRLPETAKPERLAAIGWIETPAGRVLAIAARDDAACKRDN